MSQPATKKEFGKWRSFFWPVHNFELKKLLPMFMLFFFINFNYTILRDTKDTLIVASSLLFWGCANDITKVGESKRFYAMFGLGANLAMYPSGILIKLFAGLRDKLPAGVDAWGVTLNYTLAAVVVAALCVIAIYWWINK